MMNKKISLSLKDVIKRFEFSRDFLKKAQRKVFDYSHLRWMDFVKKPSSEELNAGPIESNPLILIQPREKVF